jgi:hypothetical protein
VTVCVSVRVAEGLILAADSAVTLEGEIRGPKGVQQGVLQTWNFGNKVARIKDYPIGVMTWGIASISARSIMSLIMEFEYAFPDKDGNAGFSVRSVADSLLAFLTDRYEAAYPPKSQGRPLLGLFVGGFSSGEFFSDQYRYEFPTSTEWTDVRPPKPDGTPDFGANWFGQTDALIRLVLGYDPAGLEELVKRGVDPAIIQKWLDDHVASLPLIFDGMPLQEAIDFADYAAQVVIGRFRFSVGPPLVGGEVDIAVIRPDSFQWAQRKQWGIKE